MVDTKRIWFEEGFKTGQKELALKIKDIIEAGGTSETLIEDLYEEIKNYI